MAHGGARKGAGRKPNPETKNAHWNKRVAVRLTEELYEAGLTTAPALKDAALWAIENGYKPKK